MYRSHSGLQDSSEAVVKRETISKKVQYAASQINGNFRYSRRGVPLIEMFNPFQDGVDYSVSYFASTGTWKIFKGYLKFDGAQERTIVPRIIDVEHFFKREPYSTTVVKPCADEFCFNYVQQPAVLCRSCRKARRS